MAQYGEVSSMADMIKITLPDGTILEKPLLEYCLKKDDLNDPLVSKEHIFSFEWATEKEIKIIDKTTLRINDLLVGLFRGIGIKLIDFKINKEVNFYLVKYLDILNHYEKSVKMKKNLVKCGKIWSNEEKHLVK